jgi:hypothetical protein
VKGSCRLIGGTLAKSALLLVSALVPAMAAHAAEPTATLWGIYGQHTAADCPLFHRGHAEGVVAASKKDLRPLLAKHGVREVVNQYHSGLEHTLIWVVRTERPHDLEEFLTELGVAEWNVLKIVPLRTFAPDVVEEVKRLHNLK